MFQLNNEQIIQIIHHVSINNEQIIHHVNKFNYKTNNISCFN